MKGVEEEREYIENFSIKIIYIITIRYVYIRHVVCKFRFSVYICKFTKLRSCKRTVFAYVMSHVSYSCLSSDHLLREM